MFPTGTDKKRCFFHTQISQITQIFRLYSTYD